MKERNLRLKLWLGKTAEETKGRKLEIEAVSTELLKTRKSGIVVNVSWWGQCENVSKLSYRGEEVVLVPCRSVVNSNKNAINIVFVIEEDEKSFRDLELFPEIRTRCANTTIFLKTLLTKLKINCWKELFYFSPG